jgi:glycerol-3-phosphate dehydrogenase
MMWSSNWRDECWTRLETETWDVIIVGGGITGAGILQQASRLGLRALLVEQRDFAWGTSSRSSKMVHGGLRYLKDGNLGLTWESVRERVQLLEAGPGLIDELGFLIATYKGDRPGAMTYAAGLTLYDLMALNWTHRRYSVEEFQMLAPHVAREGLQGGFRYGDAQTDDARLVLRVLQEAVADGGTAINYVRAEGLIREGDRVVGVHLRDAVRDRTAAARGRVVINATGAWADRLREQTGAAPRIRPLRGSHLAFAAWRLPLAQAVSFLHPVDRRPVFAFPWEGITLVGTTDVDHPGSLDDEPAISPDGVAYLMAAVVDQFPALNLTLDDVIATWAGVRPVIGTGKEDPSKESRDHALWQENGLLTVTGGKLTTFRVMALDALRAARRLLPEMPAPDEHAPPLKPVRVTLEAPADDLARRRLLGRYAAHAPALVAAALPGELEPIPGTQTLWAELRWAARAEAVVHLEDLLLRRTRLGLLLPGGGEAILPRVRAICQAELGWDDARWEAEQSAYVARWRAHYSLPDPALIPDWHALLAEARARRAERRARRAAQRKAARRRQTVVLLIVLATAVILWLRAQMRQAEQG